MFFQTEKGGRREGKVKVTFFRPGFVLLLLTIGLFPESEGLNCYSCYSFNKENDDCVSPPSHLQSYPCLEEAFCKKVYSNGTGGEYFIRSCVSSYSYKKYFNISILYECAEKFFGKEGEGGCFEVTPENLKIVEDCHWSQVGKDFISKYPGFGFSPRLLGSRFGEKSCFCKEDLCNGGPIPGIKETEEKSSGVACYKCSSKPKPIYNSQIKCDHYPESSRDRTWCPYDSDCFKRTGTQGPPWSLYPVKYIERGCSSKLVPNATIEETQKLIECLKKYGGCVFVKSEAGFECFKDLMNDTAVRHPRRDVFDFNEMDELCVCEGDLCNSEAPKPKTATPKPTEIGEMIPEPMYEETPVEDEKIKEEDSVEKLIECLRKYGGCVKAESKAATVCLAPFDLTEIKEICVCEGDNCNDEAEAPKADSSHFMWWIFLVLLIIGLLGFTCLIMLRKPKEFVEINGEI